MSDESSDPPDIMTWLWNRFWWMRGGLTIVMIVSVIGEITGLGSHQAFLFVHLLTVHWGELVDGAAVLIRYFAPDLKLSRYFLTGLLIAVCLATPGFLYSALDWLRSSNNFQKFEFGFVFPFILIVLYAILIMVSCIYWISLNSVAMMVEHENFNIFLMVLVFLGILMFYGQLESAVSYSPSLGRGLLDFTVGIIFINTLFYISLIGSHEWVVDLACSYEAYVGLPQCNDNGHSS